MFGFVLPEPEGRGSVCGVVVLPVELDDGWQCLQVGIRAPKELGEQ